MDDMKKYEKYKLRVKRWEKEFQIRHRRVPSKYDIKDAPMDVRNSYKLYYKMKTSILEQTLSDALDADGFDVTESEFDGLGETTLELNSSVTPDISQLLDGQTSMSSITGMTYRPDDKTFEAVEDLAQNVNAWTDDDQRRNKSSKVSKPEREATNASRFKLNAKYCKPAKAFAKRNPRKPISRQASSLSAVSEESTKANEQYKEVLPDLETLLLEKLRSPKKSEAIVNNSLLSSDQVKHGKLKTHVDSGWLQRNAELSPPKASDLSINADTVQAVALMPNDSYGLSNINLSRLNLQSEASSLAEHIELLNEPKNEAPRIPTPSPARVTTIYDPPVEPTSSDSDSVIADSDEERKANEVRFIVKRRRLMPPTESDTHDEENHVAENKPTRYSAGEDDTGEDFSCDEDADPTFEMKDRKRAVPKRARTTKSKAEPKQKLPKEQKAKATKEPKPKAKKEPKPKTKSRTALPRKKNKTDEDGLLVDSLDVAEDEQPLSPKDFKYAIALETKTILTRPRIELAEIKRVDALSKSYINNVEFSTAAKSSSANVVGLTDEKRSLERKKLEDKVAAGKLNENYVTINIQKKKFSRGKKTFNYSRYKKKQWKHSKRVAALCGPEMNMGGCDGGVMTCFTCGGIGHYAQNCKATKGDALLPLTATAVEDTSPFPTLEEAERMATQNALSMHSRNIAKLPEARNSALYSDDIRETSEVEATSADESGDDDDTDDNFSDMDIAAFEEAEAAAQQAAVTKFIGQKVPSDFLEKAGLSNDATSINSPFIEVPRLYDLNADGSVPDVTPEVREALHLFGHTDFRKGQDRAIMRILCGVSTLVTLSTGSGKSLCYQLPAYLYSRQQKAITLVISPLVSLMEDQVTGVPSFLRAHCLHTNQTDPQRAKIQQMIADGAIDILLVSPEAVVSGERSTGFGAILRNLPPIAFACIDEVHCVSQWSHNFRPSYLMIAKVLRKNLGIKTILGLTATATLPTRVSIINHLDIRDGDDGVISDIPLPNNLILSVSKDKKRDDALLKLLYSERFQNLQSIIIYCTRRDECERIAGFLRTSMQDQKSAAADEPNQKRKRKRVNWHAEPYHAGMPASRRRTIQNAFMKNELRIVVATIAFGMGINKSDIRAVIHYNMPRSFESYVQEIGRAGRDGKPSHCHLFLDALGADRNELRRHIYANSIDRHVIRKLLNQVFVRCSCDKNNSKISKAVENSVAKTLPEGQQDAATFDNNVHVREHACPGHEVGFSVEKTVEALDIPAENISTLLCYMELDPRWCISVLSSAYTMAKVISYGGAKELKRAAQECPPLAMAIAQQLKAGTFKEDANMIEFSVIDVAAAIGWHSGVVKYQLKNLEWQQINGLPKRSTISVNFCDLGFRLKAPGDFTLEEIDSALDSLYERSVMQERTQLVQLQYIFQSLSSVAYNSCAECMGVDFSPERSETLKTIIREYFKNDYPKNAELEPEVAGELDEQVKYDIHALINMYPENNFNGRNIARIFHGIQSPNYPAIMWGRCKFWRSHTNSNFNRLITLANDEIIKRRC